jgi:hypothetical protein
VPDNTATHATATNNHGQVAGLSVRRLGTGYADGGWNLEDTDMSGAAVDYYHFGATPTWTSLCGSGSPCSSPWHASKYYPETGAAILK